MARITKNHSLGKTEAKKRLEQVIPNIANEYSLKYKWVNDYTASFEGSGAKGQFVITENSVEVDISLGFFLKVFEGKITAAISEKLDGVLG